MTTTDRPVTDLPRAAGASFDSLNPATGEIVATFPINTSAEVVAAVERAQGRPAFMRLDVDAERRRRRPSGLASESLPAWIAARWINVLLWRILGRIGREA